MDSSLPVARTSPFDLTTTLAATALATAKHRAARNVTDWPFTNFWGYPSEPRHSKLLGWFINPAADHGCGTLLLGSLLDFLQHWGALPSDRAFPVEGCRVLPETGYMDLRVERRRPEGKFALLFENKVNGATDQHLQLSYYVTQLLADGFDPGDIFVLYAPLDPGRQPAADDLAALIRQGVHWTVAPFSTCILPWLEAVLNARSAELDRGMGENLTHYRNLLRHLSHYQYLQSMTREFRDQLRSATIIPTLQDLDRSVDLVSRGLLTVLRAKLFLRAQALLRERGEDARFFDWQGQEFTPALTDEFDERSHPEVDLGLQVSGAVRVCYGGYQEEKSGNNFWTGYMRSGEDVAEQARLQAIVAEVSGYAAPNINGPWYAWSYDRRVHHGNCSEESSVACVADTLLDMRQRLLPHLGNANAVVE